MVHVIEGQTCPEVWLKACKYLLEHKAKDGYCDYNVILNIAAPLGDFSDDDLQIYNAVNSFLIAHSEGPIETVAGTIFPASFYTATQNKSGVFEDYPQFMEKLIKGWGSYAFRMVRRTDESGNIFNPLEKIIDKINTQPTRGKCLEIGLLPFDADIQLYDPRKDRNVYMGGPCLSHISIKVIDAKRINLTAIYRNHFYVQRLLGNLIGLSQLLGFVAKETSMQVGDLIIHSTSANIDAGKNWSLSEVKALVEGLMPDQKVA